MNLKSRMKIQDLHIVINGETQKLVTYQRDGTAIFSCPARCYGQHNDWTQPNGDTPPGLYRVGQIYDTQGEAAYGQWCLDLEDLETKKPDTAEPGSRFTEGAPASPTPSPPTRAGAQHTAASAFKTPTSPNSPPSFSIPERAVAASTSPSSTPTENFPKKYFWLMSEPSSCQSIQS